MAAGRHRETERSDPSRVVLLRAGPAQPVAPHSRIAPPVRRTGSRIPGVPQGGRGNVRADDSTGRRTFNLGSPPDELDRFDDEGPQTAVTISHGFRMGIHPVTQQEYQSVTGNNPSFFSGDPNLPVDQVSWQDATNYCALLTQQEAAAGRIPAGSHYRLPTEAEWEYAARATTSTRFFYGDDLDYTELANYAWYGDNSDDQTQPVGQKPANAWGLNDVSGNVWEWCQDWYGPYPGGAQTDPQGPADGSYRVLRGGSWASNEILCRSACRIADFPTSIFYEYGFRVVLDLSGP